MQRNHCKSIAASIAAGISVTMIMGIAPKAATYQVPSQYKTVQAAYDACRAGDTVIVADGRYIKRGQTDVLRMTTSGTAQKPITVETVNRGGAILDGQNVDGTDRYLRTVYIEGSYNIVRGFKIRNGYYGGVAIFGGVGNRILQNEIYDNGNLNNGGTGNSGVFDDQNSAGNVYIGNYIHDNGRISMVTNVDQGMYLCATNGDVVVNNLVARNCSYGIQVAGYNTVANMDICSNTIVSNINRGGIVLWKKVSNINIADNILDGNHGYGIGTCECSGSGIKIENNQFYDNSDGNWDMTLLGSTVNYSANSNSTNRPPKFFDSAKKWQVPGR